jgi:hypothetical protein
VTSANTRRLSTVLALEQEARKTAREKLTALYHALDKPGATEGIERTYRPEDDEGGEHLPPEGGPVPVTAKELTGTVHDVLINLFDLTAARDFTNAGGEAKADVTVGGVVLVPDAPVPYLLWMLTQLDNLRTFVERIPTHSAMTEWTLEEPTRGVWKSLPEETIRKVPKRTVLTLAKATDKHAEQVQVFDDSVRVGTWTSIKLTGGVPVKQKEGWLKRIAEVRDGVHTARQEANRVEAIEPLIGKRLLDFIFNAAA